MLKKRTKTQNKQTAFALAAVASLTLFGVRFAHAQSSVPTNVAASVRTNDLIIGQNNAGPFNLSWIDIDPAPETVTVVVDGKTFNRAQYTIDPIKGTVTFAQPLKANSIARVDYSYQNGKAKRNPAAVASKFSVPVLKLGTQQLQVTTLTPGAADKEANGPRFVWSLGGKQSVLGGGLTSSFNLAPDAKNGGSLVDRTNMALGYQNGNKQYGISAQFNRAGRGFVPSAGQAFNVKEATENLALAGYLRPTAWLGFDYASGDIKDLTGKGSTENERYALRLGGTNKLPTVNALRSSDTKFTATGDATTVGVEKLDVTQAFGTSTVSALTQRTETDAPGDTSDNTLDQKSLALSTGNKTKTQQLAFSLTDSTKTTQTNVEDKSGLEIKVQAAPTITIAAVQQTQTLTPTDEKTKETGEVSQGQKSLAIAATNKDKSQQISVSLTDANKTTNTANENSTGIEVKVQPSKTLTIAALQKSQEMDPTDDKTRSTELTTQSARAELSLNKTSKLISAFSTQDNGDDTISLMDVNAQFGMGATTLTTGLTQRSTTQDNTTAHDSLLARVSYKACKTLTLSGGYLRNPADDKGIVTEATRQEFGLNTTVGSLLLTGNYAIQMPESMTVADSGELAFTLGVRFNRYTNLTGNYKDAFLYGSPTPGGIRTYSLGLTHSIGLTSFTLGGTVTKNRAENDKPEDIKAEAKFGVKF